MNKTIKIRGIVLKETLVGESDKIITVLAKDYGKISISAKGSRKPTSKLMAGTSLFSYCDFTASSGKNLYYLTQTEPIETFYILRNNLLKLSYASYFLEFTEKTVLENMPVNNILLLILKSLKALSSDKISNKLICLIFRLKFLELNGYRPEIDRCVYCGKSADSDFYFTVEGTTCQNCVKKSDFSIKLNKTMLYTIKYILTSDFDKLFNFTVDNKTLNQLYTLSQKLIQEHFELKLKSYDFIKEIESLSDIQ